MSSVLKITRFEKLKVLHLDKVRLLAEFPLTVHFQIHPGHSPATCPGVPGNQRIPRATRNGSNQLQTRNARATGLQHFATFEVCDRSMKIEWFQFLVEL